MPPTDKSFYKVRCDYPGCNLLARHTPASDGKHYCKRHHPDLAKGIPPSPYLKKKPEEQQEPPPAEPKETEPPEETPPVAEESEQPEDTPEPPHEGAIEIVNEDDEPDDTQMLDEITTTDDEPTTNNEIIKNKGDENMNILNFGKDKKEEKHEEVAPQPAMQEAEPATLNLKLTIAELQADYLAHQFLIEKVYQSYAALGLPQHITQAEVERLVAPHRQRLTDIEAVLKKFSA